MYEQTRGVDLNGYRCVVEVALIPTEDGGLRAPVTVGNRSLLFVFSGGGQSEAEAPVTFGGVVERVLDGGDPGSTLRAAIWFWQETASQFAVENARFDVWYGRVVGAGRVISVAKRT